MITALGCASFGHQTTVELFKRVERVQFNKKKHMDISIDTEAILGLAGQPFEFVISYPIEE